MWALLALYQTLRIAITDGVATNQRQPPLGGQLIQHPPPVPGRLARHRHRREPRRGRPALGPLQQPAQLPRPGADPPPRQHP